MDDVIAPANSQQHLKGPSWSSTVTVRLKVKRLNDTALLDKSSKSYGASLAMWDHTVLPVTRHK